MSRSHCLFLAFGLTLVTQMGAGSAALAAPVEITFWQPYGPPWAKEFDQLADAFNKAHPDIHVTMVYQPDIHDKLVQATIGGSGPDIAQVFGVADVLDLAQAGALLPLDDLLASWNDWKPQDMIPPFLDTYRYKGHLWALPLEAQGPSLIWNKDVFAQSGLDPETGPADQSAFEQAIKKIDRFDADGSLQVAGYVPGIWGGFFNWAYMWGGSFYDEQGGKVTAASPANVAALDWQVKFYQKYGGKAAFDAWKKTVHGDPLWLGKAGMQLYSTYQYLYLHNDAPQDFKWGFAPPPAFGSAQWQPKGPVVHTDGNVLVATSKHPREAALALYWITDGMGSLVDLELTAIPEANLAINRYALQHGLVPGWYPEKLWLQNYDVLNSARPWPRIPTLAVLTDAVAKAHDQAVSGAVTPQAALQSVDETVQPKLDEAQSRLQG